MSEGKMFFASDEKEEKKPAAKKAEVKVEPKEIEKPLVFRKRSVIITPEMKAKAEKIKKRKAEKKIKK
jgi:hypothetical protein